MSTPPTEGSVTSASLVLPDHIQRTTSRPLYRAQLRYPSYLSFFYHPPLVRIQFTFPFVTAVSPPDAKGSRVLAKNLVGDGWGS